MRKLIMGKEIQDVNRIVYVAVNSASSNQGTTATSLTTSASNAGEYMTFSSSVKRSYNLSHLSFFL